MSALQQTMPVSNVVQAPLNYVVNTGQRPSVHQGTPENGVPQRNGEFQWHTVPIADARDFSEQLTLDHEGFELRDQQTAVKDFFDDAEIKAVYYPEVVQLLKQATGATDVHIFDHTVRVENKDKRRENSKSTRSPVQVVHNDYTLRSGPQRVHDLLDPATAEHYLQHRFAEINVWRSIGAPVQTTPLAVADAQSVAMQDFVETDLIYADRIGEIYQVAYNSGQRWFYFPKMHKNEALLLKCYDSATDGRARFTAHTAFTDPTAPADAPPRESIEVRALVSFAPIN